MGTIIERLNINKVSINVISVHNSKRKIIERDEALFIGTEQKAILGDFNPRHVRGCTRRW
jgi:hypothetical protein